MECCFDVFEAIVMELTLLRQGINFRFVLKAFITNLSEVVLVIYKRNCASLSQPTTLSHFLFF